MALAVRKGKLQRSEVEQSVLDVVDSDMSNKELKHFTKLSLKEHLETCLV
jgi:hypothetical protein